MVAKTTPSEETLNRRQRLLAEDQAREKTASEGAWTRVMIDEINGKRISLAVLALEGESLYEMAIADDHGLHVIFDSYASITSRDQLQNLFDRACEGVRLGLSNLEVERAIGYALFE